MTDAIGALSEDHQIDDDLFIFTKRYLGRAYGMELYWKRDFSQRLGGFVSYTLSRSTRSLGKRYRPFAMDRTHVLHAALSYQMGRLWTAGIRTTAYSGVPARINTFRTGIDDIDEKRTVPELWYSKRTPWFWRLDLRAEKRWRVGHEGAWVSFVIELLNASFNKETIMVTCVQREKKCDEERIGPVTVPSIGVEGAL